MSEICSCPIANKWCVRKLEDWKSAYMLYSIDSGTYEMSFPHYCYCRALNSWFWRRRVLRLAKREFKLFLSWIPIVIAFLPVGIMTLVGFVSFGCIDIHMVMFEIASIVLSSVALLFIKESFDTEARRRHVLAQQLELLNRARYQLFEKHRYLLSCYFATQFDYTAFDSIDKLEMFNSSLLDSPCCNHDLLQKSPEVLDDYIVYLDWLSKEIEQLAPVDWGSGALDRDLFRMAKDEIGSLRRLELDDDKYRLETAAEHLICLSRYDLQILASLRRPWRYQNDINRKALIEKFVFDHGVRVSRS